MFELKEYQKRALAALRDFLAETRQSNAQDAFNKITARNGGAAQTYIPVQCATLGSIPYVCLRVPTGGGKTVMACSAVGIVLNHYLYAPRGIVLWLVPSNTILDQTARALDDPRHPYRRALEDGVGPVEIKTIDQAMRMPRAAVDGNTVVIVATIQCFRVAEKMGRLVYTQEGLHDHFANVPRELYSFLDKGPDGKPLATLINLFKLHNPIVIVDEAHNARTPLTFDMLKDIKPRCIVEFTATPARENNPSNVVHRVSAMELKSEHMIKLPLEVVTRQPSLWEQLLSEAVAVRDNLEKIAILEGQTTGEYIRPIILFQERTLEHSKKLKNILVGYPGINPDEVRICTSEIDEIPEMKDILTTACPIRYIITVQKLREGWDCPFAYVLCSLSEMRSPTALEQIVGRIMRLPHAVSKTKPELNKGYAFSLSMSLPDVLEELKGALENNGFTSSEADRMVISVPPPTLPLWTTPVTFAVEPRNDLDAALVTTAVAALLGKVEFDLSAGTVTVKQSLTQPETEQFTACFTTLHTKAQAEKAVAEVAASEQKPDTSLPDKRECVQFRVPQLCIVQGDLAFEFEKTSLLERQWKLSEKEATLDETDYPSNPDKAQLGIVDTEASGKVVTKAALDGQNTTYANIETNMELFTTDRDWSKEQLLSWLDRNIRYQDILGHESAAFLNKAINGLMTSRGISTITPLVIRKYQLRDALDKKINKHRCEEHKKAFNDYLLPESPLTVDERCMVDFSDPNYQYEPSEIYSGEYRFQKHYRYEKPGDLKSEGEEFRCACFLDSHPDIRYWIRNIPRRRSSLSLQTSTDRFYPDFVCLLNDGRRLVVEYKGKDRWDGLDSDEKRTIGAIWASRSNGKCLFIMPEGTDLNAITKAIKAKAGGAA
jgi:type III restriction enzyme